MEDKQPSIDKGLTSFQLIPKKYGKQPIQGEEPFDCVVKFLSKKFKIGEKAIVSDYLNMEATFDQMHHVLKPSPENFSAHQLTLAATGWGAKKKIARCKLDNLIAVKACYLLVHTLYYTDTYTCFTLRT